MFKFVFLTLLCIFIWKCYRSFKSTDKVRAYEDELSSLEIKEREEDLKKKVLEKRRELEEDDAS